VRLTFDADVTLEEVARLAAAERECCRFFSFVITVDERGKALEVRAPEEALPIIEGLFGAAAPPKRAALSPRRSSAPRPPAC
jgi:hypothetical protein